MVAVEGMRKICWILFLVVCILHEIESKPRNFDGHEVYRLYPTHKHHFKFIDMLQHYKNRLNAEVLSTIGKGENQSVDIQIPPESVQSLREYFRNTNLQHRPLISDIQSILKTDLKASDGNNFWTSYHPLNKIEKWLKEKAKSCKNCKLMSIGTSWEGRPLYVMQIGSGREKDKRLWIDAGTHAREWISHITALYIIEQLLSGQFGSLVSEHTWYIMPVVNPDGYVHSWTQDRMWRKTRSSYKVMETGCYGTDLNRNFGFQWGTVGVSTDPCSSTFAGVAPFSEPEARAVAKFVTSRLNHLHVFLTLHSYSELWLLPWGFTYELPTDYADMMEVGAAAVKALHQVAGTNYTLGTSANVLYRSSGTSRDWAKAKGIKYVYTVELRDRKTYGFLLPAAQIRPTVTETWAAVVAMFKKIEEKDNVTM